MARIRGDDGTVLIGANPIGDVREFSYNEEGNALEAGAMGDSAVVELQSIPRVNGTLRLWFNKDDTEQQALVQGSVVTIELRPEGTGSGLPEFTLTDARIVSERIRQAFGAVVEHEYDYTAPSLADRTAQT